ncbi:Hypothetical predicted protein [Paramuricea clavata]|uniref:Uncharacterized protein n=2 Tax=Paramuricea clavata TaxID=317549 RepID=A0A6S7IAH9_PARCT|nr:Hypothetical predicted protein [Paramuricea clavata]
MSIVGANGVEVDYTFPSSDQDNDNALKCNMGLFGVMTSITMEVQPMVIVKVENDFSYTVGDLFYNPAALKQLHENNWSLEIFWFPFNSLSWLQLIALFVLKCPDAKYDLSRKALLGDRNVKPAITAKRSMVYRVWNFWLRRYITFVRKADYDQGAINAGSAKGCRVRGYAPPRKSLVLGKKARFEMVQTFNTTTRFEPMNKAIHYQSFIEVMPVLDMEFAFNAHPDTFSRQNDAMQAAIVITQNYYNDQKFPLSVAMEMRWMAYSNCLICPAHAVHKENATDKRTLYIEVLGLAGQENWEDYSKEIAAKWMDMKINGMAPLPHWAKQWSYLDGIDDYIKKGYGENLKTFRNQVTEPEKLLFSNARLNKVIFQDSEKKGEKRKIKKSKTSAKAPENDALVKNSEMIFKDLDKHVETWKNFFMTLGEQVWNVPFKFPKMDIQREWKNTEAILHEINKKYNTFQVKV